MSPPVPSGIPVVIDGSNFINRVLDQGIDHDIAAEQLMLTGFRRSVNEAIRAKLLAPTSCDATIEFVCSKRVFGPKKNRFTPKERQTLIDRFMGEVGVHVDEIDIPGTEEKGVDGEVQSRLESLAETHEYLLLVAADRDYIPVLRKLRQRKIRVIVASLQREYPKEIANEAWGVAELLPVFNGLFSYGYPHYDAAELSIQQVRSLVSNADDRQNNQVRVDDGGSVYVSRQAAIGNRELDGVRFKLETFVRGNDYVGPRAASDARHVSVLYEKITRAWHEGLRGHVD